MEAIVLRNVWKKYISGNQEFWALKNINLKVKEGEFVCIMGPSGSGKTTLLNLIGALDKPTKGEVIVKGKNVNELSERELADLRNKEIGFIFQQHYLIPVLTALENVELPSIIAGKPNKERAKFLLKLVGLEGFENYFPSQLSGGQNQRVAIARALMNNPSIILADEPTASLDVKSAKTVMDLLERIHKEEGKTIVLVTHDPVIAKRAERIVVIKAGQIIAENVSVDEALKLLEEES